mgnify:CR=1 FL=1
MDLTTQDGSPIDFLMKVNLKTSIIGTALAAIVLGGVCESKAAPLPPLVGEVAGKYTCQVGGSFTASAYGPTVFPLTGTTLALSLPKTEISRTAIMQIPAVPVPLICKIEINSIKVRGGRVIYRGTASMKNAGAQLDASGPITATARKAGSRYVSNGKITLRGNLMGGTLNISGRYQGIK